MGEAIGPTLGYAVAIAISPIPVAAVILMLFSDRARANSLAFMVTWLAGIALVTSVMLFIPGLDSDSDGPSTTVGWVKLVLGLLLLERGFARWRSRPKGDDVVEPPGWMSSIDRLKPIAAAGMGFALSALNPKNLLMAAAAGTAIASADVSSSQSAGAVAIFTVLAAMSVLVPVLGYLFLGPRLDPTLANAKDWLISNNAAVMSVLLFVFGANLLGDALAILTA